MFKIRPVKNSDHEEILQLATIAGVGMSSLPQDSDVLKAKITNAVGSFEGKPTKPQEEHFLFALEDMKTGRLAGTTGIVSHVGLSRPFYSYKLSTITQASAEISAYSQQQVLHLVNDYTGATEIGSLFLHPDYRRDGIGKFLSRSRYLMLAEFPHMFSDVVISEIRGVQDEAGNSPFYNNLARHFFKMDFRTADYIYATQGGQFIGDLMPRYPIYVNLLPKEAQDVIGVPFASSQPARKLLEVEGFTYEGYVDLFDAGPTVQAQRSDIRTVRKSRKANVMDIREDITSARHILCNTQIKNFTITLGKVAEEDSGVVITPETATILGVEKGDEVRYVA